MSIVKHLKSLNSQPSRKKPFPSLINVFLALFPCLLFGVLIGTYLDLYFIGKEVYFFPKRLFPDIFTIHIGFTLVALPVITGLALLIFYQLPSLLKVCFLILIGLLSSIMEKLAEAFGFFMHTDAWKHIYSFFGYPLYLLFLYSIFLFLLNEISKK